MTEHDSDRAEKSRANVERDGMWSTETDDEEAMASKSQSMLLQKLVVPRLSTLMKKFVQDALVQELKVLDDSSVRENRMS